VFGKYFAEHFGPKKDYFSTIINVDVFKAVKTTFLNRILAFLISYYHFLVKLQPLVFLPSPHIHRKVSHYIREKSLKGREMGHIP
jgi:hypothetical protein